MDEKAGDDDAAAPGSSREETTWGPKLFYWALIASLVFCWWLVIHDHGVGAAHGG